VRALTLAAIAILAIACGAPAATTKTSKPPPKRVAASTGNTQRGYATWYGGGHHGGATASGERYNKRALTGAHRTLPMNTRVRVTNTKNGRSVTVRINDRGPFGKRRERIIDVSEAAAERLDMLDDGVVPVTLEVLGR